MERKKQEVLMMAGINRIKTGNGLGPKFRKRIKERKFIRDKIYATQKVL